MEVINWFLFFRRKQYSKLAGIRLMPPRRQIIQLLSECIVYITATKSKFTNYAIISANIFWRNFFSSSFSTVRLNLCCVSEWVDSVESVRVRKRKCVHNAFDCITILSKEKKKIVFSYVLNWNQCLLSTIFPIQNLFVVIKYIKGSNLYTNILAKIYFFPRTRKNCSLAVIWILLIDCK